MTIKYYKHLPRWQLVVWQGSHPKAVSHPLLLAALVALA